MCSELRTALIGIPHFGMTHYRLGLAAAAEGKAGLQPFGVPPSAANEASDDPATDSRGQSAARAAMDGVADGAVGSKLAKQTGAELGSGNAPLGTGFRYHRKHTQFLQRPLAWL